MAPRALPSRVNALHWVGACAAVGYVAWHWHGFSGPFRQLVDLQVALTGRWYWEPLAVAVLLGALLAAVVAVANGLGPFVPRWGAKAWTGVFLVAAAGASGAVLLHAWHLWHRPALPAGAAMPAVPALRVLDVDALGPELLRSGPVRLVGRVVPQQQVRLRSEGEGYDIVQPVAGLTRPATALAVPVLAVCWSRYGQDCLPAGGPLEGWLVPDGLHGRLLYRVRRAGVLNAAHHHLLLPGSGFGAGAAMGLDAGADDAGEAVVLVVGVLAAWLTVGVTLVASPPWRGAAPRPVRAPRAAPNLYVWVAALSAAVFVLLSVWGVASSLFFWLYQWV